MQPQPQGDPDEQSASQAGQPSASGSAYVPRPDLARKRRRSWAAAGVLAAALACAGVVARFASAPAPAGPAGGAAAASVGQQTSEKLLLVSAADLDAEGTRKAREALQAGRVPDELRTASPEVRQAVLEGKMSLFRLRMIDTVAEDGDAVVLSLDGKALGEVTLSNSGAELSIPLKQGTEQTVVVTASRDGAGGVTFGASSSTGRAVSRIMSVGESESWTVGFKK